MRLNKLYFCRCLSQRSREWDSFCSSHVRHFTARINSHPTAVIDTMWLCKPPRRAMSSGMVPKVDRRKLPKPLVAKPTNCAQPAEQTSGLQLHNQHRHASVRQDLRCLTTQEKLP